jgi:polar amino acid transport system substrate-binding protein
MVNFIYHFSDDQEGYMRLKILNIIMVMAVLIIWSCLSPKLLIAEEELPFVTVDFPPFGFSSGGGITGAGTEIIKAVTRRMGYTPTFTIYPTKRAQFEAAKGKFAGIFMLTKNTRRLDAFYYADPLCDIRDVFYKLKTSDITWNTLEDLAAYRVGATGGYNYASVFLKAIEEKKINSDMVTGNQPELRHLQKLTARKIDMFICEISVCQHIIQQQSPAFDAVDFINKPIGPIRTFHVAFSKKYPGSEKLRDNFNNALAELVEVGVVQNILKKHNVITDYYTKH